MKRWTVLLILFASCVSSGCAGATSRASRPLDVRSDGATVLGCVPSDEGEDVEVADAGVSAIGVEGRDLPVPWSISAVNGNAKLILAPGECLAYGTVPEGYVANVRGAGLQDERPYTFTVRSPEWGKYRTRLHTAVFCVRRLGKDVEVVPVPKGPRATTTETCRQLLDAKGSAQESQP